MSRFAKSFDVAFNELICEYLVMDRNGIAVSGCCLLRHRLAIKPYERSVPPTKRAGGA